MKKLFKVLSVIFVLLYSTSVFASPINLYDTDHNSVFDTDDTCWELNPNSKHMGTVSTSYDINAHMADITGYELTMNYVPGVWGDTVTLTNSSTTSNCIFQNDNLEYPIVRLDTLNSDSSNHVGHWQFSVNQSCFDEAGSTPRKYILAHGIGLVYGLDKVNLSDADVMRENGDTYSEPNYLEKWGMRVVTHQHRHDVSSWEPFDCAQLSSGSSSYGSKHRAFCSSCWTTCLENHTFSYTNATATKHLKSCSPCGYSVLTAHVAMTVNGNTVCRYCGCSMSGGGGIII